VAIFLTVSAATKPSITLIAPAIGPALRRAVAGQGSAEVTLSWLAGRGLVFHAFNRRNLVNAGLEMWQRGLLGFLGLDPISHASAPFSALGDDAGGPVAIREGYWLQADLVHLAAGLDRLTFLPLSGAAAVTASERQALMPLLATHLQDSPLRLLAGASGRWFLHSQRSLDLQTASPEAAAANELETVMPAGKDAREVRRVMTECQMLLHEHAVNDARQRRGLPPINALWPWGGGSLAPQSSQSLPSMFSDDAFVRGLYRNHSQELAGVATAATTIEQAKQRPATAVIAVVAIDSLEALASEWLQPLIAALRSGGIQQLDLLLDEWQILATRSMLRRFWRKPSPPSAWPT
jgi:hypothetical protein